MTFEATLFADLGSLIKVFNEFYTAAQNVPTYVDAVESQLGSNSQQAVIDGLASSVQPSWLNQYVGRRQKIAGYALGRLQDPGTMADMGVISGTQNALAAALIAQMVSDSATVNRSVLTLGTVTTGGSNQGNGTVLVTPLLDRVTSPGSRAGVNFPANRNYKNVATELAIAETLSLTCSNDSFSGNAAEGNETWKWQGAASDVRYGVAASEGSGSLSSFRTLQGATARYLTNPDFELWSSNAPTGWTIVTGIAGTNIFQMTATSADVYHGASSLQLVGDGTTAAIQITQQPALNLITAGKMYCVTVRVKADASVSAGTLTIEMSGSGYTPGSGESISVAHGSLPTSWTLYHFFFVAPDVIPSNFALSIDWSSTPTSGKNLYIDDIGFGPVNYGAGIGAVAVRGSSPFVVADAFTLANTVSEGVVQKFFRQVFGVQLPSSGSPTIADSVAT